MKTETTNFHVVVLVASRQEFYVEINGVIGAKVSTSRDKAAAYADKVRRGLVRFEPLSAKIVKELRRDNKFPHFPEG